MVTFTIDNNFLDSYSKSDEKSRGIFRKCCLMKKVQCYPNLHMIGEMLCIFNSNRKYLIPEYTKLVDFISDSKILNVWNRVLLCELGIYQNEGRYVDSTAELGFRNIMQEFSMGKIPKDIDKVLVYTQEDKARMLDSSKENKKLHLDLLKENNQVNIKTTFNEFYKMEVVRNFQKSFLGEIISRGDAKPSSKRTEEVLSNPQRYVYTHRVLKVFTYMYFRHNIQERKVDKGDGYDQFLLIYMQEVDFLISDDVDLHEMAEDIYQEKGKVLKFIEFIEILKSI